MAGIEFQTTYQRHFDLKKPRSNIVAAGQSTLTPRGDNSSIFGPQGGAGGPLRDTRWPSLEEVFPDRRQAGDATRAYAPPKYGAGIGGGMYGNFQPYAGGMIQDDRYDAFGNMGDFEKKFSQMTHGYSHGGNFQSSYQQSFLSPSKPSPAANACASASSKPYVSPYYSPPSKPSKPSWASPLGSASAPANPSWAKPAQPSWENPLGPAPSAYKPSLPNSYDIPTPGPAKPSWSNPMGGMPFQSANANGYNGYQQQPQQTALPTNLAMQIGSSANKMNMSGDVTLTPTGNRKAVTVGINYIGSDCKLEGCINDSDTFVGILTDLFGFPMANIKQLRDDSPQAMPTKKNILSALKWLVTGALPGDHLFFHYSGHGSQQEDGEDEFDHQDETLCPCDYAKAGMIVDDELRKLIVMPLPKGCRLSVILDCCHSGTGLDLPMLAKIKPGGDITLGKMAKMPKQSEGTVVMISGCKDDQTSADIAAGQANNTKAAGAMTTAFKSVIGNQKDISFHSLLLGMLKFLKDHGFEQVPQMSLEHHCNFMEPYLPEAPHPMDHPEIVVSSQRPIQRRALTIGINYLTLPKNDGQLAGCINDSETMIDILRRIYKFEMSQIKRLRDDRKDAMPTKRNIMAALDWLVKDAGAGDEFFLHYSGHGGLTEDTNGDEERGMDSTLLPSDFETAGDILDDELYAALCERLPAGARLWVIMDCCHSGTALDLPFKAVVEPNGTDVTCTKVPRRTRGRSRAVEKKPVHYQGEVIMISGCRDDQTSADVQAGSIVKKPAGAMTTAFSQTITSTIDCHDLLLGMLKYLKANRFDQVPQMSSDLYIQFDAPFVNYHTKFRNKNEVPGYVQGQRGLRRRG